MSTFVCDKNSVVFVCGGSLESVCLQSLVEMRCSEGFRAVEFSMRQVQSALSVPISGGGGGGGGVGGGGGGVASSSNSAGGVSEWKWKKKRSSMAGAGVGVRQGGGETPTNCGSYGSRGGGGVPSPLAVAEALGDSLTFSSGDRCVMRCVLWDTVMFLLGY